jgi:hypothetical protein
MTHNDIIEDVHKSILTQWPETQRNEFFLTPYVEGSLNTYHHDLGRLIRNEYNLWSIPWEPEIKEFMGCMCDCSPYHPDAVSMTIIKEVWKRGPV